VRGMFGIAQCLRANGQTLRIPTYPPTCSDNIRPVVPGYPPTFDALP